MASRLLGGEGQVLGKKKGGGIEVPSPVLASLAEKFLRKASMRVDCTHQGLVDLLQEMLVMTYSRS